MKARVGDYLLEVNGKPLVFQMNGAKWKQAMSALGFYDALVAAGFGVSVVPAALAQIGLASVSFLELDDQDAYTELLIVHRHADLSPLKLRFLQLAVPQLDGRNRRPE